MVTAIDKNTALVLIDLQKAIVQGDTAHPMQQVLANAAKLANVFRGAGLPVVLVSVDPTHPAWGKTRKEVTMQLGKIPAEMFALVPELNEQPGDIRIIKHSWGAFFETALDEELKKRGVTGIVLGGVSTSIGVEGTARQAGERSYNIAFAQDAMTDRAMEAHERSMKYIFPRMGEIDTTENIIAQLARREA